MFVINANASGSATATAYATGGGGNTTLTSANGYYDIPMNGSTYNMFRGCEECGRFCWRGTCGTTYTGWDGTNPNEDSVISCGMARSFDKEVLFPDNYKCGSQTYDTAFNNQTCMAYCCYFPSHNVGEIVEIDLGSTPKVMVTRTVTKRKMCGGEKVGKTITSEIGQRTTNNYTSSNAINCCICCKSANGYYWIARKCPIIHYVDLGLIHEDGTTNVISHIERKSAYGCLYLDGDYICNCETPQETENFIKDHIETEGVIACKGDRLYYEYGIEPQCMLFDVYTNEKGCTSCTQTRGTYNEDHSNLVRGLNANLNRNCIGCCAYICSICDCCRFNGIQFSIE